MVPGDVVLAYRLQDMGKSVHDMGNSIRWLMESFRLRIVVLHFPPIGIVDTGTEDGFISLCFFDAACDVQRNIISERTRQAQAKCRHNGGPVSGIPRLGFRIERKGRQKRLVEDEREQEILRVIEELAYKGLSIRAISSELIRRKMWNRKGDLWAIDTIWRTVKRLHQKRHGPPTPGATSPIGVAQGAPSSLPETVN